MSIKAQEVHEIAMNVKVKEVKSVEAIDEAIVSAAKEGLFEIAFPLSQYPDMLDVKVVQLLNRFYTDLGYTFIIIDDVDIEKVRVQIKWAKPLTPLKPLER